VAGALAIACLAIATPVMAQPKPPSSPPAAEKLRSEAGEPVIYRVGNARIRWNQSSALAPSARTAALIERLRQVEQAKATGEEVRPVEQDSSAVASVGDRFEVPLDLFHTISVRPLTTRPAPSRAGEPVATDPRWLVAGDWAEICHRSETTPGTSLRAAAPRGVR
jgi:hypothetical protein